MNKRFSILCKYSTKDEIQIAGRKDSLLVSKAFKIIILAGETNEKTFKHVANNDYERANNVSTEFILIAILRVHDLKMS